MRRPETNEDAATLALRALVWVIGDDSRRDRFLALTGIAPADLRARAADPGFLAQLLAHLEAYEPDLLACADALAVPPAAIVAARAELETA
jgi:adenine/guanine phosphoribosyltransferase-like PRPP-binding protein